MKEIKLTQGMVALVDDEDYEKLVKYKWCVRKGHSTYYTHRNAWNGKNHWVSMHREVLGLIKRM